MSAVTPWNCCSSVAARMRSSSDTSARFGCDDGPDANERLLQAAVAGKLDGLNAQPEHLGWRAGEELDVDPDEEAADDDDDDDDDDDCELVEK